MPLSKPRKFVAYAAGALIALLAVAALALVFFFDLNAYKRQFEAAASAIAGMKVRIDGRVGIGFFPGLQVTLEDVHIRNRGTELASAAKARIGVDVLALFDDDVRISKVVLERPVLSIERDRHGRFNFEKTDAAARKVRPALSLASLAFADGTLRYADRRSGSGFEATGCRLDANRFELTNTQPGVVRNLSIDADIACGGVLTKHYAASDLKFTLAGQDGLFDLDPLTMRVYDGDGSGSLHADFTGTTPHYQLGYAVTRLRVEALLKPLSAKPVPEGLVDVSAKLAMQGETVRALRQTLQGQVSLRGKALVLNGRDLDQEFGRFESSQRFNLVDVGAFLLAGPAGLAVTKGYNFASVLQGSEGRSEIRTLVSDWTLERGVARSQDVAIATKNNRVALQGRVDFANERFPGLTIALIDDKGCIRAQQTIHGTFKKPVVENPSALKALSGPVLRLLKQAGTFFPGGACEVFYAGSVAAPK